MDDLYAPVNQQLTYGSSEDYSKDRDQLGDAPGDPYDVPEDYYVKLAMRQSKSCGSKVAREYFSVSNIKRIQKGIRREIYNRTYKKFRLTEDQNVLDLLQAMLVVYNEYGKDLPDHIVRQVKTLNEQTIQYVVPDIKTAIEQHYGYLDDIKNPINPLPQPLNVNHAGRSQLRSTAQLYDI
jgi:hypothetical protein